MKLLIDADYFWYRSAATAEEEHEYNEELTVIVGNFTTGKRTIRSELKKLQERFDSTDMLLCFTDRVNFRKSIDPEYKGNRTKRKPCGYLKLKQWGMETFPSMMVEGLEADDVLGILATNGTIKGPHVIISPDKDMQQVEGRLYNLKEEWDVTKEASVRKLYEQCLCGDQTDGYAGCRGVGPKKAGLILDKVKDGNYWPAVVDAYKLYNQTEEDALRNLQLSKILQAENWDPENKQPILITS
tara:strand:+ start:11634 stop:12359 length:726 start_codon:yes stop_codon:yes gene_type:complete